jgi:hypothetical protein
MNTHAEELFTREDLRRRGECAREEAAARREHFLTLLEEVERVHPFALTVLGNQRRARRLAGRGERPNSSA